MAASAEEQQENTDGSTFDRLTGTQKSAILMMLIGEDEASEILRNLSPREVQHLVVVLLLDILQQELKVRVRTLHLPSCDAPLVT